MELNEIKNKTSNATRWSSITEILARCVLPLTNMILARLLTPEAFGVVATITMITSFADVFTDAGFQKYLIQHDFKDRQELDRSTTVAFWTNLFVSMLSWIIVCIFSKPLAALVGRRDLWNVIIIASLSLPMTSFSSIQMARFKRDFDFKSLFFIRIITLLVPFFVTVPMAIVTHSFWALICGTLATNLVNAIFLTVKSEWKPTLYFNFHLLKSMFSYSMWILLESIATWLTSYIGTFIVGIALTDYYLGIYKTSMTTVNQIFALIVSSTSMPLFSALSRLKNDEYNFVRTYRVYIKAIGFFVIPLGVGIYLYRELITSFLLGDQWAEAADFIGLWGLMSSVSLIFGTYCNGLFNAKGKTYLSLLAQILHLVVLIPVLVWSSNLGYHTLYISRTMVRLELILVELVLMKICFNFPVKKLFKDVIPVCLCTLIMFICGVLLNLISENILFRFFAIIVCILIYFISSKVLFGDLLEKNIEVLGFKIKLLKKN